MWSGSVTICAFPLLLVPSNDAHSLPINGIRKGMCVIVSGFLWWLCIMPSKPGEICRGANFSSITDYSPVCLILDSFGYLHTLWKRSTKPFTKRLSRCGGKWICISCILPYTHHLLSHSPWSVFHDLRPDRIAPRSVKMLHKTVYETVEPLWR